MAERAKQKETELDRIKRTMMETGMVRSTVYFITYLFYFITYLFYFIIPSELNLNQL
jgi:hypothetical protein